MAANFSNTYVFNESMELVCTVIRSPQFWAPLNLNLKSETPIQNGVMFRMSASINFSSWGEQIDIIVVYVNESSVHVTIRSECVMPTQIVDWGKNKQNVEKICSSLAATLTATRAYNQNVAASAPKQASQTCFCTYCGAKNETTYKYCGNCGAPIGK